MGVFHQLLLDREKTETEVVFSVSVHHRILTFMHLNTVIPLQAWATAASRAPEHNSENSSWNKSDSVCLCSPGCSREVCVGPIWNCSPVPVNKTSGPRQWIRKDVVHVLNTNTHTRTLSHWGRYMSVWHCSNPWRQSSSTWALLSVPGLQSPIYLPLPPHPTPQRQIRKGGVSRRGLGSRGFAQRTVWRCVHYERETTRRGSTEGRGNDRSHTRWEGRKEGEELREETKQHQIFNGQACGKVTQLVFIWFHAEITFLETRVQ